MCPVLYMDTRRLGGGSETPEKLIHFKFILSSCHNSTSPKKLPLPTNKFLDPCLIIVHVCWFIAVMYSSFHFFFYNLGLLKEYCRPWRIHEGCYQNPTRAVCRHIPWKCHRPTLQGHLWVWYLFDFQWRFCCGSTHVLQFRVWTRFRQSLRDFFKAE